VASCFANEKDFIDKIKIMMITVGGWTLLAINSFPLIKITLFHLSFLYNIF